MKNLLSIVVLLICWQSVFAEKLNENLQNTGWNLIRSRFLDEDNKPVIFDKVIAIKLVGSVSPADSICMNELISQLKIVIPGRKIYLTSENENIVFNFSDKPFPENIDSRQRADRVKILRSENYLMFPSTLEKNSRKKILYFRLYKSLVTERQHKFAPVTQIAGCVFCEKIPENISFHTLDSFIISKLYADDFQLQLKNYHIKENLFLSYIAITYRDILNLGCFLLGLLCSVFLLSVLIIKGVFKAHNWNWLEFNKQGLFLILIGSIYSMCILSSDLILGAKDLSLIMNMAMRAFLAVNIIFITERLIFRNHSMGGSRVLISFFTTFIGLTIFSFPDSFMKPQIYYELRMSYNVMLNMIFNFFLPYIIVISLARSLYIFLNDRYKSIINQKDVELARKGELQKQAELQSLRAKINPHFLYNALNSIASLATTNAKKTEQMALGLSDFFKYAINREQKQLNSLSEELNATRTYLEIEKVRFGDRLNFDIECNPELLDIRIPQLLIQPLVENAIKHGLSQITGNGMIRIVIRKENHQLNIRVYDNGPAFPDGPLSGFGIQNTQERITLLYGSKAIINWKNVPEKYIELSLPLMNQDLNSKIDSNG